MLKLESLERRELMASDVAPFHNSLMPHDVDGDYRISPLDALIVINDLNAVGSGSLSNRTPPSTRTGLIDTDGDNTLSPLDALTIINSLNSGEGETLKAAVKYEFYAVNADGSIGQNLDPNPNDAVSEAVVNKGQKFVVRTLMADFRNNPFGVFSAYHDLTYTNANGSTDELMELQWSDYNGLKISMPDLGLGSIAILTGSFKLQYGSETTQTINIATRIPGPGRPPITDVVATAANIQAAIAALPSIGAGNVTTRVNTIDPALGYNFDIFFRNAKARVDIPNPTIVEANFTVSSGGQPTPTISGITNPDSTIPEATRAALNYVFANQTPLYVNGPNGFTGPVSGTPSATRLNLLGAFSNSSATIPQPEAFNFYNIVDTTFVGASAGNINLRGSISPLPVGGGTGNNLGIALYNDGGAYLTESQVSFENAVVRIVERLTAVEDMYPINEDAALTTLNVTSNDINLDAGTFGIISVTQPAAGGTVSFDAGGNAQSVRFLAAPDYNGPSVFTYTIRSSTGIESTGFVTVTVNPINDAPRVIGTQFAATEDQPTPLVITPTNIFTPGPADEVAQAITLSVVTGPTAAQGTASINTTTGNLEFRPAADFFGLVTLVVRGVDSGPNSPAPNANTTNATITINVAPVNDAPRIVGSSFTVVEDATTPLSVTPAQLFTPGPANEATQSVTLSIQQGPSAAQGTATIAANGSLQFTPAANYFGSFTMVVRGTDNGTPTAFADSTITINVTGVNDAPDAVDDTAAARFVAIGLTGTPTLLDVMRNDNAGPGETNDTIRIRNFTTTTTQLGGTVAVNTDRTRVIYTPPANAVNVVDSFTYSIEDSGGLTDSARADVFIFPPVLPYAIDDNFVMAEVPTQQTRSIEVLGNDLVNAQAIPRLVSIVEQPIAGRGTAAVEGLATPNDPSDDRIVYTAPANFFGTAVVKYRMTDSVETSEPVDAFLTIVVTEVNDAPVAVDKQANGTEDITATILGSFLLNGLSKGPGEDAQTLTVTGANLLTAGSGTVDFDIATGNVNFIPTKDFNGPVLIQYTVTDNGTTNGVSDPKSSSAVLSLDIAPVNDAPITTPKSFTAVEDTQRPIDISAVIAGDLSGPDNENTQTVSFVPLTGTLQTQRGGTVVQNGSQLLYTPALNFNGIDTFTYQITDGQQENQFASGLITVNVSEVNDAPIANNITKTVFAGVNTIIDVTAELAAMSRGADNESSQTVLISDLLSNPSLGTIQSFNGTQIVYFAPLGTDGSTSFTFQVSDNGTTNGQADPKTSSATFTIQILPFVPSSFRGTVFIDDNANGVLDRSPTNNEPLELPIGGVEVTISYPDPANPGQTIQATEMTSADGSYDFELLPPGTYTISYSTPSIMTAASAAIQSYTRTVVAPGDSNVVFDFPVLGIIPEYGSHLEYLASSFYNRDGSLRSRGMYAAINNDGITEWTARKDGFEGDQFNEVVLSNDGSRAYLTSVRANGDVYTATLVDKRQFIKMQAGTSGYLIRVLASSSELNWVPVTDFAAPPVSARGYLDTVDDYFAQEGYDLP